MFVARVLNDESHPKTEVGSKQVNHDRASSVSDSYEIYQDVFIDGEKYALEDNDEEKLETTGLA